ncbi:MAG TPA: glycosyltransferase [Elusimicrobiota bacterium]|nr:glycosyltransferase [Elusimicrobiota bacterium]
MILALNEKENVKQLLGDIKNIIARLGASVQILVIDGGSTDGTGDVATESGARVILQDASGYGRAIATGIRECHSRYILTMDADLSHPAEFIETLWGQRNTAELIVASRYVPGAKFEAPILRKYLSRILNIIFTRILTIPVHDVSSGYRLYDSIAFESMEIEGENFEVLEEILIKILMDGWTLREIPFHYAPRQKGHSKARLIKFGISLLMTLKKMWGLRASIASADYDERAYSSIIPLQRYWQRKRHQTIVTWAKNMSGPILDVGCGSSRILQSLENIVGLDVAMYKLRYMSQKHDALINASVFNIPFATASFSGAICSQVIEHIPQNDIIFKELARVIEPGGLLIIGTPDYGKPYWPMIEWAYQMVHPNGYADEHITHYTFDSLVTALQKTGFTILDHSYILGGELNILARKDSDSN